MSALPRHWLGALFHPWTWRMAWRDSRSQRLRLSLYAVSIIFGMAALVAIHALKETVTAGMAAQAKALLGSDLHIASRQPIPADLVAKLTGSATRASRETGFASMLSFPGSGGSRLVSIRGIEGGFPFYGTVETSPADAWERLHREPGILLEPALLDQFNVKVGDRVKLGALELPILGTMLKAPPRSSRFASLSPEAYVRLADLGRTGLLGTRSLASYDLHLELAQPRVAQRLKKEFSAQPWRFETPENRRESLEKALRDMDDFLGLVALVALVLGAVGVAGAIHAHVQRRVSTVALLRCLGCPGDVAFTVYLVQALALGLAGAVLGGLLGGAMHAAAVVSLKGMLPVALDAWPHLFTVAQTTLAGFAVCAAFALLPLRRVRQVAPIAALREGAAAGQSRRAWPMVLLLGGLLMGFSMVGAERPWRVLALNGGLGLAFVVLALTARAFMWAARASLRREWPYLLRQGVANLYRPRNQTLLFLLSLGLGTFLLLTVLMTRDLLADRASVRQFGDSPNLYLIDVQPDQRAGVAQLVQSHGLPVLETAPMVTMRISEVRGTPVRELEKSGQVPRWILQREFRSTFRPALNATEKIVAGTWSSFVPDPNGPVPLSLEKEIARDLKVAVGDELTLDVVGQPIHARVTSLREVDWSRFNLNFFMVFPPGVLEDAPGFHVLTTRLPAGTSSGALQRALVNDYPNVTAIDLTLLLETVRSILAKITRAITLVAAFTVLAGLPILIGALINGREQRIRESVLLRTLGASTQQVRTILLVEYTALGLLSALSAVFLAVAANAALAFFIFKTPPAPSIALLAGAFASTTLLAVVGGTLLSRGVTRHPPLQVLRRAA